jgi:hypothetical protein
MNNIGAAADKSGRTRMRYFLPDFWRALFWRSFSATMPIAFDFFTPSFFAIMT